jgi:hypothetical protein
MGTCGKFRDFGLMAFSALCRHHFFGRRYFVCVAVTRCAGLFAGCGVNTLGHRGGFLGVAGSARHFRDFGRVRKIGDRSVAILAAENSMGAGRVFRGTNGNIPALFRFHPRLPVTSKASLILL